MSDAKRKIPATKSEAKELIEEEHLVVTITISSDGKWYHITYQGDDKQTHTEAISRATELAQVRAYVRSLVSCEHKLVLPGELR